MLIGLGGLYGMAGQTSDQFASAAEGGPIAVPGLTKCHKLQVRESLIACEKTRVKIMTILLLYVMTLQII